MIELLSMTPHEAEEFQKTGKAEAEAQFDKILARSKGTRQQLAEAREVAADLSRQLQEAGTTQEVADLQVKPWEMMLANAARMLGTSPKDMAKRMNIRVAQDGNQGGIGFDQAKNIKDMDSNERATLERMRAENDRVSREIQEFYEGKNNGEISLGEASETLQMFGITGELKLGVGQTDKKGKRHPGVLEKLDTESGKHAREGGLVKNLYSAIQNPIAVFQLSQNLRRQSKKSLYSVVLVTELEVKGKDGWTKVIAPVLLYKGGKVTSVYGLDAPSTRVSSWVQNGLLMGYERKDGADYLDTVLPDGLELTPGQGREPWRSAKAIATGVDFNPPMQLTPSMDPIIYDSVYSVKHFDESIDIGVHQGRRGSYTPFNTSTNTYGQAGVITLMQESDKSTFMHESSHVWLDFHTRLGMDIADKFDRGEQLTAGEQEFLRTLGGFFKWGQQEGKISLGVDDTPESVMRAVRAWANLSIDEQRGMHELFAEGFERYLLEGYFPSYEVKDLFQKFKSWLLGIYKSLARQPNPISPEVKKLYDLLFVSEQEVADAEVAAGMIKLFESDDAKVQMTDEERKQYEELNQSASLEAQGIISKAVAGVMRMYTRVRQNTAKAIYRDHKKRIAPCHRQADGLKLPKSFG